jgi:cap2 methyltransferase
MINDDRFILQTLDYWNFGLDNTKNLMDIYNSLQTVREAAGLGDMLLVTADGSIDCQKDPGECESTISYLH